MFDRRKFLMRSLAAGVGLGLGGAISPRWFTNRVFAGGVGGGAPTQRKLITIFLRGGNDSVNTVIPRGDSVYSAASRPTLFIPEATAIDTGNGFAQLHPSLSPLMEVYNHTSLNGVAGPGNLAVVHRVGYENSSRSHFDGQRYWETGNPGDDTFREGMLYRKLVANLGLGTDPLSAAALDSALPLAFQGDIPVPSFPESSDYAFAGTPGELAHFLGELPTNPGGSDGKGFYGLYGGVPDDPAKPYRSLLHATGVQLGQSIDVVQDALAQGPYTPENSATYPNSTFGNRLQEAAMLLKRTSVRVIGLNQTGYDTHTNQETPHGNLLGELALGIQALSRDLQSQWGDVLICVMSEFARTSLQNGSGGTDHASAGAMLLAGGSVVGGVYNCDSATWADGDMLSDANRYVLHRTDFRSVFGEIFTGHFGDDPALLEEIIPGYSAAAGLDPGGFAPLGLFV